MGPSGLGGEVPRRLGDDEGVAAENDGDVVAPTWKASSFEVVEAELAASRGRHAANLPLEALRKADIEFCVKS
jgi:hypothetical protein